jgi:TRAP-type mannitol/chloroaromatic compound transport system permease small subunit
MTRGPTSPSAAEQVAGGIDRLVCWLGRAIAWLCLAMVLMTATVVVLRYFFDSGWI